MGYYYEGVYCPGCRRDSGYSSLTGCCTDCPPGSGCEYCARKAASAGIVAAGFKAANNSFCPSCGDARYTFPMFILQSAEPNSPVYTHYAPTECKKCGVRFELRTEKTK